MDQEKYLASVPEMKNHGLNSFTIHIKVRNSSHGSKV